MGLLASIEGSSDLFTADPLQYQELPAELGDVFQAPGTPSLHQVQHRIDLINEDLPPHGQCAYCMSPAELAEYCRQIADMLDKSRIRPSYSPFGALLLFFKKMTGERRIYIDYRKLNKNTRLHRYPIPWIDYLLDRLAFATVFSKNNLTNAYHQVPIAERNQYKTEF